MASPDVAITVLDSRRARIQGYTLKVIDLTAMPPKELAVVTYPTVMGGPPLEVFDMAALAKVRIELTHPSYPAFSVEVAPSSSGPMVAGRSVTVGIVGHPSVSGPHAGSNIPLLTITLSRVGRCPMKALAYPMPPGAKAGVFDDPGGIWTNPAGLLVGLEDGAISNFPVVPGPPIAKDEKSNDWGRFHSVTKAVTPGAPTGGTWIDWLEYGDPNGTRWLAFVWVIGRAAGKPAPNATDVLVLFSPNTDLPRYAPADVYPYKRKYFRDPALGPGPIPLIQPYALLPYFYLSPGDTKPKQGTDFAMAYQAMAAGKSLVFVMPIQKYGFWGPLQSQDGLARFVSEVLLYVGDHTLNPGPPGSSFQVNLAPTLRRVAVAGYSAGMDAVRTLLKTPKYLGLADGYANAASKASPVDRARFTSWAQQLRALPPTLWAAPESTLIDKWKEIWAIDGFYPGAVKTFQDEVGDWFTRTNDAMLRIYATDQRISEAQVISGSKLDPVFAGVTPKITGAGKMMAKEYNRADKRATFAWFTEKFMSFVGVDFMPSSNQPLVDAHHTIPRVVVSHAVSQSGFATP